MKRLFILFTMLLLAVVACRKDSEVPMNVATTTDEVQAFETYATIKGTINCAIPTKRLEMYLYTNQNISSPDIYELELIGGKNFEIVVRDLQPSTIYNYRFIIYSDVDKARVGGKKFKTLNANIPTVQTMDIDSINIGRNYAVIDGEVLYDGGYPVTARGMCWSTIPDPTVIDNYTTDSMGIGQYSSTLTGLEPLTTYYVRAYATNQKGTAYGEQKIFTTVSGLPKVTTSEVSDITINSAICGGKVLSGGGFEVLARGVCWSTNPNPTISDSYTTDGLGVGTFTSTLTNLTDTTIYYVRAYATNENGTSYGEVKSFSTTVVSDNFICGHEYVDLGLPSGLKWATCNIGAAAPEDIGDYYAWGETTPKANYTEENSLTLGDTAITDITGNPIYDAATANWGCTWRMPTKAEIEELVNNCTLIWVEQGTFIGIMIGYTVIGPNGNSIFLPVTGYRTSTSISQLDVGGFYWTSTPVPSSDYGNVGDPEDYAYYLNFSFSYFGRNWTGRNYGLVIRPVSN